MKSRFYESAHGVPGIAAERDPASHAEIRKIVSSALGAKALRVEEAILHRNSDLLISQLRAVNSFGENVNIKYVSLLSRPSAVTDLFADGWLAQWYDWFCLDTIGEVAFGTSFAALKQGNLLPYSTPPLPPAKSI